MHEQNKLQQQSYIRNEQDQEQENLEKTKKKL